MDEVPKLKAMYPAPGWRAYLCGFDEQFFWSELNVIGWVIERHNDEDGDMLALYVEDASDGYGGTGSSFTQLVTNSFGSNCMYACVGPTETLTDERKKRIEEDLTRRLEEKAAARRAKHIATQDMN